MFQSGHGASGLSFLQGDPEYQGGGTVDVVTPTEVQWAGLPDREEAGSPNVVGAVAMAVAARALLDAGMETIEQHEASLTAYALERLQALPGITLYGATDARRTNDRVGVIAFNLGGMPHALVAAILGYEGGIGVRERLLLRAVVRLAPLWISPTPTGSVGSARIPVATDSSGRAWSASAWVPTTPPRTSTPA